MMRYGHQSYDDIRGMPVRKVRLLNRALERIIVRENTVGDEGEDEDA